MRYPLLFLLILLALLTLSGCSGSSASSLTPAEEKNFAGAPRPANANEMMQKSIEEFRKKHPPQGSSPQPMPGGEIK